jgi:hypothetical protein
MGRMDLDSGKFYAKVLLKEPLPLLMQQSIEVFARGTGSAEPVMWPDKENRQNKRAAGHPPEAYIAYPSEADRQAALDENQQRPGEWGFYAAAARSGKDEKGRKSGRAEGETREPFTELQPPNMERSGLLGDVPSQSANWAFEGEIGENWNQEAGWSPEPWSAHDFQWSPEFRGEREPEIEFFVDSPAERNNNETTWPSAALVSSLPALPAAEELVRPFDSTTGSALDLEEAEYRKMVLCLPECLMDNGEDSSDEYKASVNATPVRGQRLSTAPSTPGTAAAVALWRPIHNGLPCQNTFIHFQDRMQSLETFGSSRRSKSCPIAAEELETENERPAFARAQTFDFTPSPAAKLPPAEGLPDFGSPHRGSIRQRAVGLREKTARHALETPVRREAGQSEDEPTPAPKTNPRHMRRGTRGRGSSSKDKNNSKMQWRPTLWKENGEQY